VIEDGYSITVEKDKTDRPHSMADMHLHTCHEIYFLVSGRRRYFIGHSIYDVAPGNVVIIPRGELHRTISVDRTGYDRYLLYFYENRIGSLIESVGKKNFEQFLESGCYKLPQEIVRKIQKRFEELLDDKQKGDKYLKAVEEQVLREILLLVMRFGEKNTTVSGGSAEKIQEAAQYISENYGSEITLHTAAGLAYMEDTYFSKQFNNLTGFGFNEYLTQTRIKAAEKMLLETQLSVGEIAENCGFSAANYFGDVFKSFKGVSPSQFRKLFKQ